MFQLYNSNLGSICVMPIFEATGNNDIDNKQGSSNYEIIVIFQ